MKARSINSHFSAGAYTLPDAAHLLRIPASRLRTWVSGVTTGDSRRLPAGAFNTRSSGRDRHFDFYTLIELFTIAELRKLGVSMRTLREARAELIKRFGVPHPFALKGLLTDGRKLLKELGNQTLLELGTGGQSAFQSVLEPFCRSLDFDAASLLASRYFPLGRDAGIVVDPRRAFGRPVLDGTNIATETVASLLRAGESIDGIAEDFRVDRRIVEAAQRFELQAAA